MPVRALVVDDSSFFRRRISEVLNADHGIEVVGLAVDGRDAVRKVAELKPDVITMDIEMPVMDGITAVREIMQAHPTPVLMFSSLSREGAEATLNALEAGAMDYMPKRFEDISQNRDEAVREFCRRVKALGRKQVRRNVPAPATPARPISGIVQSAPAAARTERVSLRPGQIRLLAIGASTGGPVALQKVISKLPASFPMPVVIIQHMPAAFTPTFAARLDQQCRIRVREATDGDMLEASTVYIAPGGRQMLVRRNASGGKIVITDSSEEVNYKPCVNITLQSLAIGRASEILTVILTGMGSDGCEGAKKLKAGGGTVWAQDQDSCVVYGMPAAVAEAGVADKVLPLEQIGLALARLS